MTVLLPAALLPYTGNRLRFESGATDLSGVLYELDRRFPGLRFRIVDEQDRLRPHIHVFVNREVASGLLHPLSPNDEVRILLALSGGAGGSVHSIHVAHKAAAPVRSVSSVLAVPGRGLEGDRYFTAQGTFSKPASANEITLIELEAIQAIAREADVEIAPGDARRNVVTQGVPLNHFVGCDFDVGAVRLRGVRLCEPCFHLESLTRAGVRSALVHRGGLRARIVTEGEIRVGDPIRAATGDPAAAE